jgi:hypothetical protein
MPTRPLYNPQSAIRNPHVRPLRTNTAGKAKVRNRDVIVAIAVFVASVSAAWAQSEPSSRAVPAIDITVDPRIELFSIIFRLAGHPEYNRAKVPGYAKDVDEHFAALKDHAVVQTARRLRGQYGVSFDAPMSLAVHLKDAANLELIFPLFPWPEGIDNRWKPQEVKGFLSQAKDFSAVGNFQAFFDKHKNLYQQSVARMEQFLGRQAHLEWFGSFFGTRQDSRFHLVLGMLNGPDCYGARAVGQGRRDLYCILGVWSVDAQGIPIFDKSVIPTVVHEFAHSYVNPLIEKWFDQLKKAGQALFPAQEERMRQMHYGNWRTMMIESLVRASVIRHAHRYDGPVAAKAMAMIESRQGFVWMPELADLLGKYEWERRKYPTLEAFMPRVVEFFNAYATRQVGPGPASKPSNPSN